MNREQFWRKHAPPGHEDAFAKAAAYYRDRQSFAAAVLDGISIEVNHEIAVDRACVVVIRMRAARLGKLISRVAKKMAIVRALSQVPEVRLYGGGSRPQSILQFLDKVN